MTALCGLLLLAACPAPTPEPSGPGQAAIAPLPAQVAMDLNREGKALYREGHFAEARAKYQSAQLAEPGFLAPWINRACAFAREEKFDDATREATALIRFAYVPGAREVMEAADLGALQIRPPMLAKLKSALSEAAKDWARATQGSLLLVGRTHPPVKLEGQGVLVLGMNQEIYAWQPRSGRFFQLTVEDGRVLALVWSKDGRTLVYLRAGRLVRTPGQPDLLRGLSVRHLDLDSMDAGPVVEVPGDVRELTIWSSGRGSAEIRVAGPADALSAFRFDGQTLEATGNIHGRPPSGVHAVVLSAKGVTLASRVEGAPAGCGFSAQDETDAQGVSRIRVTPSKGKAFTLDAQYGAGLYGLPFPGPTAAPSKALSPARKTR
ncbi:MAG TPA: hypothetical protein VF518_04400 [Polyangia bacterium]